MISLKSDLENHRYGVISTLASGALYLVVHFMSPFILQTHALMYDLLFELFLVTICIFVGFAILFRVKLRPITHVLWFLLATTMGTLYVVVVPTVLDRSVSLYILSRIDLERGSSLEELERRVEAEYFADYQVVPTRLLEQSVTGNVKFKDERVSITNRGERFVAIATWYKNLLKSKYRD